jgi:hypothetical protein
MFLSDMPAAAAAAAAAADAAAGVDEASGEGTADGGQSRRTSRTVHRRTTGEAGDGSHRHTSSPSTGHGIAYMAQHRNSRLAAAAVAAADEGGGEESACERGARASGLGRAPSGLKSKQGRVLLPGESMDGGADGEERAGHLIAAVH